MLDSWANGTSTSAQRVVNPYSASLFRTLKYRPDYPSGRFESLDAAREWADGFTRWYNEEHFHSGIGFVTPADRHAGRHREVLSRRREVFEAARKRNPERWSGQIRNLDTHDNITMHAKPKAVHQTNAA